MNTNRSENDTKILNELKDYHYRYNDKYTVFEISHNPSVLLFVNLEDGTGFTYHCEYQQLAHRKTKEDVDEFLLHLITNVRKPLPEVTLSQQQWLHAEQFLRCNNIRQASIGIACNNNTTQLRELAGREYRSESREILTIV